jgi:hypothetical protein
LKAGLSDEFRPFFAQPIQRDDTLSENDGDERERAISKQPKTANNKDEFEEQ